MRSMKNLTALAGLMLAWGTQASHAIPLVTSLSEHGTGLNANPAVATSATSPFPGNVGDANTSAALVDEAFAYVTRTHEYTAVRTNAAGTLSNVATDTLQPFPSYLNGLEYVQIANENRGVADYSLDIGLSGAAKAYLFVDNRANGDTGTNNGGATTDPILTGNLAWVVSDGWSRVNTGFMPNGQPDYLGIDEGGTVADATLRAHHDPGSGISLNNYFAIYSKDLAGGGAVGLLKSGFITNINFLGVAFAPLGPPLVLGDTNDNGTGGEYPDDFNPIMDNFRKSPRTRAQGDLTGNGLVDFDDFRQWKAAAMASGTSLDGLDFSFFGSVPEPSTALMSLITGAAIVAGKSRRRRRAALHMKGRA